ncbi:aldolase/citrate lyase family protein [Clostridium cochlearium]|uniref:aldolase/citrate lyase family protein n=1 Tax=Clostridium cochlearium TaxID=1494 RepID=UPI001EDE3D6E|nr:aldolase/citrate lyase family protein [Clostridium cochlearium]MCG4570976.1 aldolase/citrate lyase family protein [Clostridium cochlearium]MCG4579187.1 aldolase/citrate lyase family protein [Clostridium cochlearium]
MKLRRSMLFVPGNNPGLIRDVQIYKPDSVMFDLEDSISITEKDSARFLVHNMLKKFGDYYKEINLETVVRINGLDTEYGLKDLEAIVLAQPDIIRIPKTETPEDVFEVERHIERIEKENGIEVGTTKIMVAIESPLGVLNAYQIATSSKRLIGMAIGGEDFVTNMKTNRSPEGIEMLTARGIIAMAARAAGISALDSVYSDIHNDEGFLKEAKLIKQLGFDGKSLIHPRQIELIHSVYTPSKKEIDKAYKVVMATEEAIRENKGVFTVDGKMIDKPIIDRANHVLALAKAAGVKVGGNCDEA